MRIYTNASAFSVWKNYNKSVSNLSKSMQKLSSGLGIVRPSDDPAGLAISEKFRSQVKNSAMASHNIENAISYIHTADSWLQGMHDILGRMAELAIEAHDGTKTVADRSNLNLEFTQLQTELGSVVQNRGKYNTANMFSTGQIVVQVGPDAAQTFSMVSMDLRSGGAGPAAWRSVYDVDLSGPTQASGQARASRALGVINNGIVLLANTRATLGAEESRLGHTLEGLRSYEENITAAESRIRNVDVAKETANFSKNQILVQAGTAMLAQANSMPQNVLALING